MASKRNGTLYTGSTSNLLQRVRQHKSKSIEGFTKKYNVNILVYYEHLKDLESAGNREKIIKKWNRKWKIKLIENKNFNWKDLYDDLLEN